MGNWIYFLGFIVVTALVGMRASKKIVTSDDYISASGTLGPLAISCTLIATWLGTGSLIGFVGTGYTYGVTVVAFTAGSALSALVICLVFSRWTKQKNIATIPQWLDYIYGDNKYIKGFSSLCYIFMYCSWTLGCAVGCGTMCHNLLGIPTWLGAVICCAIFTIFTVTGGLYAVAWMDVFQQVVMTIGMILLVGFVGSRTGWFDGVNSANLGTEYFNFSLPNRWYVVSITMTYFCGHLFGQTYYQRIAASRDLKTARIGLLCGGAAVLLVGIYCLFVGLSVRAAGASISATDDTVFWAISTWLPKWMTPVYLIAILAAAFSTADSALNSASSNVARDIYKNIFKPEAKDQEVVKVAKIATVVLGMICLGLSLRPISMLVNIFKGAQVCIVGGIFWPIILGMFWKKATLQAAIATIPIGALTGIAFEFIPALKVLFGGGAIPACIVGFLTMVVVSLATKSRCGGAYYRKIEGGIEQAKA
ncbi:MAG: sodium:solute symporter family protein [Peptococcaceae bacterium]|nr:sodium:solute symporter family protein [Peptococcaceae bacterium]